MHKAGYSPPDSLLGICSEGAGVALAIYYGTRSLIGLLNGA